MRGSLCPSFSQSCVVDLVLTSVFFSTDRNDYFKSPVNKQEVPDYYDIIQHPMCWSWIENKLEKHEYWDLEDFKVGNNCSRCLLTNSHPS